MLTGKHCKTVNDTHRVPIVQVRFCGNLTKEITVISCDVYGVVYISTFEYNFLSYHQRKTCFINKAIGACYTIAPLILPTVKQKERANVF